MDESSELHVIGVGTVGVPVADQERARAFYVEVLGFEVRRDVPFGAGDRWLEVAPAGAVTTIALQPAHGRSVGGVDTGIRLFTADAEADHAALVARGVDVDAEILRMGGFVPPMFTMRDPEGNTLYVVQGE